MYWIGDERIGPIPAFTAAMWEKVDLEVTDVKKKGKKRKKDEKI